MTGETGVGKEVFARHLHELSCPEGKRRPFVAVDSIAMPAGLAESVLFGHEKGAFTGADRDRSGAFEDAGDGSVLLDEIGDMDLAMQGKLAPRPRVPPLPARRFDEGAELRRPGHRGHEPRPRPRL